MSQVLAGCCCAVEPPTPDNCCANPLALPSTISVSVSISTQVSITQYSAGLGGCVDPCGYSINYGAPTVYRAVTITGNIVLWRWDGEFGVGCKYYPLASDSFDCTDVYGTQYTLDHGYAPVLTTLYNEDYFASRLGFGGSRPCGNVLRGIIPVAGGILWAHLEQPNVGVNGFAPTNPNASQTCACWRLSVTYALTVLRRLSLYCDEVASDDRTYNRFFVFDDVGGPVVTVPVSVESGTGTATDDRGTQTNYSHCTAGIDGGDIQALRNTSTETVSGKWKPSSLMGEYRTMDPASGVCQGVLATTGTRMTATIS